MFGGGDFVCRHMQLTKEDIVKAIRENNISSFEELQDETDVATICGSCRDDVENILMEELEKRKQE